jgi:hypothetical protein
MMSAAAAAPDAAPDDDSAEKGKEVKQRLFTDKYDPDYHNFVVITGTVMNPVTSPSGDFSFVLKVQRSQANKLPGEPDVYDSFVVEAPIALWQDYPSLVDEVQQDVVVQVNGKLRSRPGEHGAPVIKVLATDIGTMTHPYPEDLVASGQSILNIGGNNSSPPAARPATRSQYTPTSSSTSSELPPGVPAASSDQRESTWIELFQNPAGWFDNRTTKKGRQPDFRSKFSTSALWIEDRQTPAWVFDNLEWLPGNMPYTGNYPHTAGGGSTGGSNGVPRQLDFLPAEAGSDKEAAWMDVFRNYRNWWDNRLRKLNPKAPDFKHKTDNTALWVISQDTPRWVVQHIEDGLPRAPAPRPTDS